MHMLGFQPVQIQKHLFGEGVNHVIVNYQNLNIGLPVAFLLVISVIMTSTRGNVNHVQPIQRALLMVVNAFVMTDITDIIST